MRDRCSCELKLRESPVDDATSSHQHTNGLFRGYVQTLGLASIYCVDRRIARDHSEEQVVEE